MSRRVALGLLAIAACVGDDPPSGQAPDASVTPDGSPGSDSGTASDAGANSDAGADAPIDCIAPASGIVSWWTGDETFADHLGKNDLALVAEGGTVTYGSGRIGKGFSFASAAHLERASPTGLDGIVGLTVDAWIEAQENGNNRIVDRSTAGTPDGWLFDLYLTKLRLLVGNVSIESQGQFPTGQLTHVAGTFDGTTLRLFIDGSKENEKLVAATQIPSPSLPLRVGGASIPEARFKGLIDEVAVYSRALSPNEVKAIHQAGANGRCR